MLTLNNGLSPFHLVYSPLRRYKLYFQNVSDVVMSNVEMCRSLKMAASDLTMYYSFKMLLTSPMPQIYFPLPPCALCGYE